MCSWLVFSALLLMLIFIYRKHLLLCSSEYSSTYHCKGNDLRWFSSNGLNCLQHIIKYKLFCLKEIIYSFLDLNIYSRLLQKPSENVSYRYNISLWKMLCDSVIRAPEVLTNYIINYLIIFSQFNKQPSSTSSKKENKKERCF